MGVPVMVGLEPSIHVAVVTGVCMVIAASVPAVIAAVLSAKTRRENRDQHTVGQEKVDALIIQVGGVRQDVAELRLDVADVKDRVIDLERDREQPWG